MAVILGTNRTDPTKPTSGIDHFETLFDTKPELNNGQDADWAAGLGEMDHIYTGANDDFLDGGADHDELGGGEGNDTIVAGPGNDIVHADVGDDIYYGGSGIDRLDFSRIFMNALGQSQANSFPVTVDLAFIGPQDTGTYGSDQYVGFEDVWGGGGDDTFYGSSAINSLNGFAGDDFLDGRAGNDGLVGGEGEDTLIGGTGVDQIIPGDADGARDIIRYLTLNDSSNNPTPGASDRINGFEHGVDKIDLSAIDADISRKGDQPFRLVGRFNDKAFGEVRLRIDNGDTIVEIDGGKAKGIDMVFRLIGVTGLSKDDFIL